MGGQNANERSKLTIPPLLVCGLFGWQRTRRSTHRSWGDSSSRLVLLSWYRRTSDPRVHRVGLKIAEAQNQMSKSCIYITNTQIPPKTCARLGIIDAEDWSWYIVAILTFCMLGLLVFCHYSLRFMLALSMYTRYVVRVFHKCLSSASPSLLRFKRFRSSCTFTICIAGCHVTWHRLLLDGPALSHLLLGEAKRTGVFFPGLRDQSVGRNRSLRLHQWSPS